MRAVRVAVTLVALAVTGGGAEAAIYEVVELRGDVLALPAFASSWSTLEKGDRVAEDTLVQARSSSYIAVKGVKQENGAVPSGFTLSIKKSMITRLGPETRRVGEIVGYFPSFSDHVGEPKKDVFKEEDKGDESENDGFVRSAWERVVSLFGEEDTVGKKADRESAGFAGSPAAGGRDLTLAAVKAEDEKVGDEFEPVTMVFPKSGQSFLVDTLPTGLAATWEPAVSGKSGGKGGGKGVTYRVVLRREDAGTYRVLGETDELSIRFKVDAPGHYYLKVETTDGRFRSRNQLFVVQTFDGLGEFAPVEKKEREMPPVEMR